MNNATFELNLKTQTKFLNNPRSLHLQVNDHVKNPEMIDTDALYQIRINEISAENHDSRPQNLPIEEIEAKINNYNHLVCEQRLQLKNLLHKFKSVFEKRTLN